MLRSKALFSLSLIAGLGLTACTNPYDPGQRAVGGGVLGAGTGAAIGAIAGGGRGAAIGALAGGALGAGTGAVTTPREQRRPEYYQQQPVYQQPAGGYYPQPAPGYYQQRPAYGY